MSTLEVGNIIFEECAKRIIKLQITKITKLFAIANNGYKFFTEYSCNGIIKRLLPLPDIVHIYHFGSDEWIHLYYEYRKKMIAEKYLANYDYSELSLITCMKIIAIMKDKEKDLQGE